MRKALLAEIRERQNRFTKALLIQDELGAIIRSHLYIEYELNSFIETIIKLSEIIDRLDLSYRKKIDLAIDLGLPKRLRSRLVIIGELRNRFAHKIDAKLSNEDADRFIRCLNDDYDHMLLNYNETKEKYDPTHNKFEEANARDKITMCLVYTWSSLIAEVARVKSFSQ